MKKGNRNYQSLMVGNTYKGAESWEAPLWLFKTTFLGFCFSAVFRHSSVPIKLNSNMLFGCLSLLQQSRPARKMHFFSWSWINCKQFLGFWTSHLIQSVCFVSALLPLTESSRFSIPRYPAWMQQAGKDQPLPLHAIWASFYLISFYF